MTDLAIDFETFSMPWVALILLALALLLLETERWSTRSRRRRGAQPGRLATLLDAIVIVCATLAVASVVGLLVRGAISVGLLVGDLVSWIAAGLIERPWLLLIPVGAAALAGAARWFRRRQANRVAPAPAPVERSNRLAAIVAAASREAATAEPSSASPPANQLPLAAPPPPPAPVGTIAPEIDAPAWPADVPSPGSSAPAEPQPAPSQAPPAPAFSASSWSGRHSRAPVAVSSETPQITPVAREEDLSDIPASISMMAARRRPTATTPQQQSFLAAATPATTPTPKRSWAGFAALLILLIGGGALAIGLVFFRPQIVELLQQGPEPGRTVTEEVLAAQRPLATASLASDAQPQPTPAPTTMRVRSDSLNMRAGPGIEHPILASLPKGAVVTLLNETQTVDGRTWVKVRIGEQEGWVSQNFLE